MIGVVVDVLVDGVVVRSDSNNRNLLNKVLEDRTNTASR
ncbi:hypothetical protein NT6N_14260 [Oceaniferula spumae]|uniref:Uncharacterized protein n=1 Tax=Oceaniferula spumae TaxID=2979115 RepID=A0AAT9FKB6_9BACT